MKTEGKCYSVSLVYSDWGGNNIKDLFVTNNEDLAKFYCSRGNVILEKYKKHFSRLKNDRLYGKTRRKTDHINYSHISNRAELVNSTFMYSELNYRNTTKGLTTH